MVELNTTSINNQEIPLATSATLPDNFPGFFPSETTTNNNNNKNQNIYESNESITPPTLPSATVLLGAAAALLVAPVLAIGTLAIIGLKEFEQPGLINQQNINQSSSQEINPTSLNEVPTSIEEEKQEIIKPVDLSQSPIMKELGSDHSDLASSLLLGGAGAMIVEHEVPSSVINVQSKIIEPLNKTQVEEVPREISEEDDGKTKASLLAGAGILGVGGLVLAEHSNKSSEEVERPTLTQVDSDRYFEAPSLKSTDSSTPTITNSPQMERATSFSAPIESSVDHGLVDEPLSRPNLQSRFSDSTYSPSITSSTSTIEDENVGSFENQRAYANFGSNESLGDEPRLSTRPLDASVDLRSVELSPSETGFPITSSGAEKTNAQQDFAHLSTPVDRKEPQVTANYLDPISASTSSYSGLVGEEGTSFDERTKWGKETYVALGATVAGAGVIGAGLMTNNTRSDGSNQVSSSSSSSSPFQYNRLPSPQPQSQLQSQSQEPPVHHRAYEVEQARRLYTPPSTNQEKRTSSEFNNNRIPHSPAQQDLSPSRIYSNNSNLNNNNNNQEDRTPSQLLNHHLNASNNNPNPVEHSPHLHIATRVDSISGRKKLHKDGNLTRDNTITNNNTNTGRARSQSNSEGGYNGRRYASEGNGYRNENIPANDLWKTSMAQVVNDETAHRGGHRPAFVTIDTEDRRGVPDSQGAHYQPNNGTNQSGYSHLNNSNTSNFPSTPPPHDAKKLTKNRRASVSNVDRDRYMDQSTQNGSGGSPVSQGSGSGKKEGFLHKVFSRHRRSESGSAH